MIMSQPQTPRVKTKLSLDIPPNFSNMSRPDSPSSQFTASPVFASSKSFDGSVPASPTFSGTLNSNRSQAELTMLLKEAYNTIREREKDLTLAAEIGKSLLEQNIAIKSKYESAIVQLQHHQRAKSKASTFMINPKNATLIAPPNTSLENISENITDDYDESDNDSLLGWSSALDLPSPSGDVPVNRKSPRNSSGINYKDLENIKDLEIRNQELQHQLDEVTRELDNCDKSSKTKLRKLESDLKHYIDACSLATQKVEDLEKENDRLVQKQKSDFWNLKYKKTDDNEDYITTLLHKVQDLEDQNHHIERSKSEIERRLQRTSTELEAFKNEYNDLLGTAKDYEMLQLKFHDQENYIAELSESLEEQRALVVNYRSGMWSAKTSRANSISDSGGIMSNALRRLSDPDGMRAMFGAAPKQINNQDNGIGGKIKKSLLSELESEWIRELTIFQRDVNKGNGSGASSPAFSPIASEQDLNDFFISNGARMDDEMVDYLSDDEFSFLDEFEVDNEKANRIREWFWIRWARAIYLFLRKIWRWCRFILILIAAVIMALYRGPDDVLPNM